MKRISQCVLLGVCLALPSAARAAEAPAAVGDTAQASAHFNRGVELYREGNLDAALAEFARANEIAPNYRLLYNLAQVQAERHDYVKAIELLTAYLEQGGSAIPPGRRQEVEQEGARLRARVATLQITTDAVGATLWINDERVATLPLARPVLLNPGTARLRIEAEGRKPYRGELSVAGGDQPRLQLALEVLPIPGERMAPPEPKVDTTPVLISGIAAGSLAVGSIVFGALTAHANGQLDRQLDSFPGDPSRLDSARSKVRTFAALTDSFAIGALLATGTATYFLISPSYEEPGVLASAPRRVQVCAGLGSLWVEGQF